MLLEKWRKLAVDFITVGIWTQSPESGGKFLIVRVCTIGRGGLLLLGGALEPIIIFVQMYIEVGSQS